MLRYPIQIFFASILGILLLPIFLVAVLVSWMDSGTPILYLQKRMGKNKSIFHLFKLRTMDIDAERHTGASLKNEIDRTTRSGHLFRELKIDEIPQLINVLKGEMNLVGPRPERPIIAGKMLEIVPDYFKRFKVKPGLTGPAQLYTAYDTSKTVRLEYDLDYIENRSLAYDAKIIINTIGYIVSRMFQLIVNEPKKATSTSFEGTNGFINKKDKMLLIHQNDLLDLIKLKSLLRKEGYAYLVADDLDALSTMAETENPDLIVCDLYLDNPSHVALCLSLKHNKDTKHMPLMVLTASQRKEDFLVSRELHVDEYCAKPIADELLKKDIFEAVSKSRFKLAET